MNSISRWESITNTGTRSYIIFDYIVFEKKTKVKVNKQTIELKKSTAQRLISSISIICKEIVSIHTERQQKGNRKEA